MRKKRTHKNEIKQNTTTLMDSVNALGDLREKSFNIAYWPKGFFVQPGKTGTVTWEQLVAMYSFPLNEL